MIDTYWTLDTVSPTARAHIDNVDVMHKTVCTMLGSDRAGAGALWALDDGRTLVIRSHTMPDIEALYPTYRIMTFIVSAPVPDAFTPDMTHRFQLTASNVKRDNRTRALVPIRAEDWLMSRAERCGFRVDDMTVRMTKIRGGRAGRVILISAARYTGTLTITDADAFADAMRSGIGRGKAYGCGLLTID